MKQFVYFSLTTNTSKLYDKIVNNNLHIFENVKRMFSTPESILYIIIVILVVILLVFICILLILLKEVKTTEKKNSKNSHIETAEHIYFSMPRTGKLHGSEESENLEPIELQKYSSAYILLDNRQKIVINSDEFFIGYSKTNNLTINEPGIAQTHCKIKFAENSFYIFDLISQTGTFLNDKKILRPRELNDWDEILLGNTLLVFRKSNFA